MVPFFQRQLHRTEAAPVFVDQVDITPPAAGLGVVPELLHEHEVSTSMLLRLFASAICRWKACPATG